MTDKKLQRLGMLIALIMGMSVIAGCAEIVSEDNTENTESNRSTDTLTDNSLPSSNETMSTCATAITDYLEATQGNEGEGNAIKAGDNIVVDYIGRFEQVEGEDTQVFDTSIEAIAQACGKHSPGRDYTSGLPFTVGAGQMIPGFDKAVVGMKVGQTETITLAPEEAYGGATATYPKDQLPPKSDGTDYQKGDEIMTVMGPIEILEATDTEITIPNTHELAGKTLIFDITIKEIK